MDRTDQELVRTALQGADPEAHSAFAELADRWKGPLYRFLYTRVRHVQDAEDLTFKALFEAWRSLPSLRGEFRPWLFGIGWNVMARSFSGKGVTVQASPIEQALLEAQPVLDDPSVRMDLAEALSRVSPATLNLLREKFMEGKSYRDLEEIHGIAASTLRDHMTEACHRLELILQQRGLLERFLRKTGGEGPRPSVGGGHG